MGYRWRAQKRHAQLLEPHHATAFEPTTHLTNLLVAEDKDTLCCAALTCDSKSYSYTLRSNFSNLECSVGSMTVGLRRVYLNKDARFWHRNAVGPWDRVMQT